ncbi:hypothetical protein K435DRAFT_427582 [Dendrothele bispora CBS 962.96]|uniref:Uncharacterized protein n=1 Tax=Dendrothele bispora (strain CBS 962.96) TaxID=1314807 RepID=A0A4S8MEE5_DENBC|nr:hypothetical protein K435DRAFT_427582 [Dendrothele bispora CBS 962.96]
MLPYCRGAPLDVSASVENRSRSILATVSRVFSIHQQITPFGREVFGVAEVFVTVHNHATSQPHNRILSLSQDKL